MNHLNKRNTQRWTHRALSRVGALFVVLFLVSALIAPAALAQDEQTGSDGSASTGSASESTSLSQATPGASNATGGGASDTAGAQSSATESSDSGSVGGGGETGSSSGGTNGSSTPQTGDGSEIFANQDDGSSTEDEATQSDGTPVTADEEGEGDEEIVLLDVVVTVYNCESNPGGSDPSSQGDCAPVGNATVTATVGLDVVGSASTDGSGQAVLALEDGATVQISQEASTITSGYMALASSKELIVSEGAASFLVNVRDSSQGRFQVASGQCFTLGEPRIEMMVIGPMVRAADEACGPAGGVEFSLTGGNLSSPMSIVTSGAGSWTGYLAPGEYTLSRGGTSVTFDIAAGAITAVVSIDYVTGPSGTLTVQRYVCTDGEASGVSVQVFPGGGGGAPDASCSPDSKNVEVYSIGGGPSMLLDLQGGSITVNMAAGMGDEYVVRDTSGQCAYVACESAPFLLEEGETVQVVIVEVRILGSIAAQLFYCNDPASNFEDPTIPGYWESECAAASSGITVTLRDAGGTVVSGGQTGSGGTVGFADVLSVTYSLSTNDMCAAFSGGVDARAGFAVSPHGTTSVALYACAKPSPPPGNGGGNNTGGNNSGGNNTGGNGANGGNTGGNSNTGGGVGGPSQGSNAGAASGSLGSVPTELFSIGQFQPTLLPAPKPKLYVLNLPGVGTGEKAEPEATSLWLFASIVVTVVAGGFVMAGRKTGRRAIRREGS